MIIFLVISVFVLVSALTPKNSLLKNRIMSNSIIFTMIAFMIAYIPFLDVYVSDMVRYVAAYQNMSSLSLSQIINIYEWEPLFLITQWFISRFSENPVIYVLFTYIMFILILYKTIKKIFLPWQRMFVVFVFLCFPFFYMYVFDGIRQGLAIMLLMLGISYWTEKKNSLKFYLCLIASGLFHDTAFIMAIIIIIVFLFKLKLRTLLSIWGVTAILFLTGLNAKILNFDFFRSIVYIAIYADPNSIKQFGEVNKLNFFVFTSFFLFASLFLYKYIKLEKAQMKIYSLIIKCYIGFSAVFLLFGFIAYSNRIAMYSWFLIPLLICYPVLYSKKYSNVLLFFVILIAFITSFIYSPFIVFR